MTDDRWKQLESALAGRWRDHAGKLVVSETEIDELLAEVRRLRVLTQIAIQSPDLGDMLARSEKAAELCDKLVAKAVAVEREACAAVVEGTKEQGGYTGFDETGGSFWQSDAEDTLRHAAAAIRARTA